MPSLDELRRTVRTYPSRKSWAWPAPSPLMVGSGPVCTVIKQPQASNAGGHWASAGVAVSPARTNFKTCLIAVAFSATLLSLAIGPDKPSPEAHAEKRFPKSKADADSAEMAAASLKSPHPWDTEIEGSPLTKKFSASLATFAARQGCPNKRLDSRPRETMRSWSAPSPRKSPEVNIEISLSSEKSAFQACSGALLLKPGEAIRFRHLWGFPTDSWAVGRGEQYRKELSP